MSYHTIIIVGHVGRDPELRYLPSGQAVASFSVATSRKYTSTDGQQMNETAWFRVTAWGKQAENVSQYVKKGQMVLVEGRLKPDPSGNPRIWTRQDGTSSASYEVTAQTVQFLGSRGEAAGLGEEGAAYAEPDAGDIPF